MALVPKHMSTSHSIQRTKLVAGNHPTIVTSLSELTLFIKNNNNSLQENIVRAYQKEQMNKIVHYHWSQ